MNHIVHVEVSTYHTIVVHSSGTACIFCFDGTTVTLPPPMNPSIQGVIEKARGIVEGRKSFYDIAVREMTKLTEDMIAK